jgi:UTP--glucose-1-phosphate uridylyltransferase
MPPLGATPVIQLVAEELLQAGITSVLVITGRGKEAIENHFDGQPLTDETSAPENSVFDRHALQFFYTRQSTPLGLGDAIRHGEGFARGEDFVVALGDCVITGDGTPSLLQRMIAAHRAHGAAATIAVQRVSPEQTRMYGMVALGEEVDGTFTVTGLVEKPGPERTPSPWAVTARYVLSSQVYRFLSGAQPGYGGEIQLTDALDALARAGGLVLAVPLGEKEFRLDVGNMEAYSRAFLRTVLTDAQAGPGLRQYTADLLNYLSGRHVEDPDRRA